MPFCARIYEGPWEPVFLTLFLEYFSSENPRCVGLISDLLKNPTPKGGHLALHWWASVRELDDSAFN